MLSRRDLLRLGLGGTAALLPIGRSGASTGSAQGPTSFGCKILIGGGQAAPSPAVTPFSLALRIPPVLAPVETDATTDYYEIDIRAAQVQILPGLTTPIWGYDGLFPGPTIRAREGRQVVVRQRNRLGVDAVTHLHGARVAPEHDGHPLDVIPPGGSRDYVYPNRQPGATLWYHDHTAGNTGRNIYYGLSAFYLLAGSDEARLNLPTGEFDVPLTVQDRTFAADGSLVYQPNVAGMVGDTILINGTPQPRFEVARRKYRFRLLNASNYREYEFALDPPLTFSQIASDVGLLPAAIRRSSIRLVPAERVEVVVDFSAAPVGSQILLRNTLTSGRTGELMRFDVVENASDPSRIPPILRPLQNFGPPVAVRRFGLQFENGQWVINHKGFDPGRIDAAPRVNTAEIWEFANETYDMHPMHLHLAHFRVLNRGRSAPPVYEVAPKDTVAVRARETVRVFTRFEGFTGPYLFHCHRLEHEDFCMMGQFRVVP